MNIRQQTYLRSALLRREKRQFHGDRIVLVGSVIIAVVYAGLIWAGVV